MPKVIVTTESQGKIGYELTEDLISIGRASDNTIPIDDPSVSGRHAQLERSGETYRLKDLGSTNGTRLASLPLISPMPHLFNDAPKTGTQVEPQLLL